MKKTLALFLSLVLMLQPVLGSAAFALPSALKAIQAEAFAGNKAITGNLELPDNVRSVGDRAFADTDVFALWLPAATTSVGSGILAGADTAYVVVENATASLADSAFDDVEILFGKRNSTAQRYAERNDLGFFELENAYWHDGFVYYNHGEALELVTGASEHSGSVTIPQSVAGYPVEFVSGFAFLDQDGISSISLPDTVKANMPEEEYRSNWPSASISFYSTGVDPVIPPEADPENGGFVMELDIFPSSVTLMPGETFVPILSDLPDAEYIFTSYSTDESVVAVNESLDAFAVAPGSAAFTVVAVPATEHGEATASELGVTAYYGTVQIRVVEPEVSIDLFESTVNMNAGQVYYPRLEIKTPSTIFQPELDVVSADPAIADAYFMDNELMLEAFGEGKTTITVSAVVPAYGDYEAVTATAEIKVSVTPAAFETTYATLYTYTGFEHDFDVISELEEDDEVSFETINDLITYNEETARIIIGEQSGESAVVVSVTHGDGTQESVTVPVYIKPFFSFGEPQHRDDLNPGWEYHYEWQNLMPDLSYDLWAHDNGLIYTYAEAADEQLSIENEMTAGKPVIRFSEDRDEAGNTWVRSIAQYPGSASVTYYATLNTDILPDTVHVPVIASEPVQIAVQPADIVAHLDEEVYHIYGDEAINIGYWYDGPYAVQQENFTSSDESIFTVNAQGGLIPHNAGEATLTYTVWCFGVCSIAEATVVVHGGSLDLAPAEATISVGETVTLVPVLPEGVNGTYYNFYTEDDSIAIVDDRGVVTGLRAGSTYVCFETEIDEAPVRARSLVHVVDEGARLSLNATSLRLYEGEFYQLEAIFADGDEPVSIEWTSSNHDAVSVDENGIIVPGAQDWSYPNSEIITCTATFADGSVETASCLVYAEEQIIRMTDDWGYYKLEVGQTQEFYGTASFAGHYTLSDFDVSYASDNEEIVIVDENGMMTTLAEGTAKVYVIYELDGRCVFTNYSFVHVSTPIPQLGEGYSVSFNQDYYFIPAPPEGEVFEEYFGAVVSDPELHHYYTPAFSAVSDPEDAIVVYEDGRFEIYGPGTAEVFVTLVSYDESVYIPEDFGSKTTLVVGETALRYDVTSFSGEEKETVFDEESGLPVVELGDIVTITLEGVPENVAHRHTEWDHDYHAFREIARTDRTLTLQAQRAGHQTHLYMETELDCNTWFDIEAGLIVAGEEAEFSMGEPSVVMAVGETVEIHPSFPDWEDGSFTTVAAWAEDGIETDPSEIIEIGEEFPQITAIAPGRVQLLASVTLGGEKLELPVYVTVVESDWSFNGWYCDSIMYVGQGYDPQLDVVSTGYHGPSITFAFSDDSLIEMNYDDWCLIPLAAGEVTITATIEGDGRIETVTRDVTIIEPSLTFADGPYMQLIPGERRVLTLVNNTGREIEAINWSISHSSHAQLNADNSAPLSAVITANENYTNDWFFALVTATVTFTDGTTDAVSARIEIQPAHEVWPEADIDEYYFELYPGETREIGVHSDDRNTRIIFFSENESVAAVSANGVVTAAAPGEANIIIRFENYAGNVREERITVFVHPFSVKLSPSELYLGVGESAYVVPEIDLGDSGYQIDDGRTNLWPVDDSVVSVDHLGLVTAKAPGSTVIVYETYTSHDDHRLIAYCPVTVMAGEGGLTLSETEISLRPREEFQLSVAVNGNLESEILWTSSNPDVISVTDTGLVTTHNWDIFEAIETGAVYATAMVDGVETTAVCKVNLLPASISLWNSPNFYELGVGELAFVRYSVTANDPSLTYHASFESTDETIMTVDESGVMTGVSEGVCMVRLSLTDENGVLLCSGAAYVYVGTPLPTPADDGAAISFDANHYYMTLDEEMGKHRNVFISDPAGLGVFYELHIQSDNEDVVVWHGGEHIEATGEGTTTLRAWFEGFEEYAATAIVTVGNPYLTFDKPLDENGCPIVAAGDTVTVTIEGMPTFGNMDPTTQVTPQFVNFNADLNGLREVSRGVDEEGRNTFTLMKLGHEGTEANIDVLLECGWQYCFEFYVCLEESDDEFRMNESAIVMAIGEEVDLWPDFDWKEYVSFSSSNEEAVTVEPTDEGALRLTALDLGDAVITAEIRLNDDSVVTTETKVHAVKAFWRLVHLDHIPDPMTVSQHYELNPHILISGYHYPEIVWESSDPSILSVETFEHELDWHAVPKAPGVVTLTCYATMNGETQSMSKDVTVTEPRVYFADLEPEIRPSQTKFIPLVIAGGADANPVEHITYYAEDADLVFVEDGLLEYGEPGAKITCHQTYNSTRVFAVVEFKDGSVAMAASRVHPMDNESIWVNAYSDDLWLSTEPWGANPMTGVVNLGWDTNAALNTDPGNTGTDTAWIEWRIEDENIARIAGFEDQAQNNGAVIEAVGEGETAIYATIRLYDAEGNEIASSEVERRIFVEAPYFEVRPEHDTYYLEKADGKHSTYVNWQFDEHGVGNISSMVYYSDNPSVVFCDQFGNILAENSGETDVHCDVYIDGHYVATGTAHVVVTGSNVVFWKDSATLNKGESLQLIVYPQLRSDAEYTLTFTSDNEAVARINENGLLYAVAPGRAMIACWLETADGYVDEAQFFVTVTGETPDFTLSTSTLKLYPGASYTFTDDLSGFDSVSWCIEGHENIFFDAETQTVSASHNDEAKTYTAVITCEATKDGVTYTANCHVALLSLTLDICNYQFGDGAWHSFLVGNTLSIWESYLTNDPSIEVTVDIWTDDENIAFYNPDINAFEGRSVGNTMAYYKVTGSNGETHTCSAMLRVVEDEHDVWPERIDALHADHAFVVNLRDGERGFPFVTTPEYSGCEMFFYAEDEGVLSFSGEANDGRMRLHNVGRTTVTIEPGEFAPEGLESAQGEVLVLDPERIMLAPVDENGNPIYDLPMGQTYQLTFTAVDGGILWGENDIESITYSSFWNGENNLLISETGELNVVSAWADSLWVNALVRFKDGSEMGFTYDFHPVLAENQAYFTMHDEPLSCLVMPVNSYHDNAALVYNNERIVNFIPNSTDASVAEFVWNDYWQTYTVQSYTKTGEVTLTGTATLESGETITASMQVVVREGEAPDVTMEASKSLLTIGEEVSFGISKGNGFTIHPNVDTWMSSDESILAPKYDAEGNPIYDGNFVAVGLGEATVTAVAHYGGVYRNLTCTVHVSDYPAAYLDESHVDLRPDEKHQLILMENEFSTKEIASVQWTIDDASIVSFTPFEGNRSVSLTGVAKSGDTVIRATVTDTDGSVTEYAATIHITTNDEVWVDPWHDEVWLSTESWGVDPVRAPVWQSWNHNASHFDEIGRGSDKAWIEWEIEDENIVVFDGFYELQEGDLSYGQLTHAPWNNGPMVKAVSTGNTVIKTHLVLTDKDGNFLAECRDEIPVHVIAPTVNVYAEHDTYEVQVGRSEWVDWRVDGENIRNETSSKLYTDDPSIAVFNMYGDIVGVKPGETTMHYDVVIGSTTFTGSARVIVSGPEFRFEQSEITVNAGETVDPGLILSANGYSFDGPWWHIDNPGVVTVLADGTLYANAPGATYVNCEIDVDGIGYMEIRMLVRVTGEAPAFCLSSDVLTLWQESTAQLKIVSNTDETLNEETIRWSTSNENLITVDQEGNLTVLSGDEPDHDQVAAVFCDAETTSGDPVSMVCVVTVPAPSVRINEYQFWDGSWYGMNSGDTLGMWESYTLLDPSLTVDVSVAVDDESIVQYCYDSAYDSYYFRALSAGVTDVHYTITASSGETYTRSMRVLVDQNTTPEFICIDERIGEDNSIALCLEDGDQYVHVWFEPEYTGTDLRFRSSDDTIVTVDELNSVLHPQNPGHATIFVECPDMPHLNTQFDVSIISEANVRLVAEDGRTALGPNDSVKLVFETTDGVMWRESDAVGFEFQPYYDDSRVWIDENSVLHTRMNHGEEEITVRGVTWFMDHRGVAAEYTFSVDENEPYFFLSAWDDGNGDHMTLAEGSGFHLYLNTNQAYDPATLIYSSSNPEAIDFFGWDEEASGLHVHAFGSGEAELTVTIPECGMTATFPVSAFVPTEISKHISVQDNLSVVRIGDEFEIYDINDNEDWEHYANFDEIITYESDNPAVLDTIANIKAANDEDPESHDWMTLRALTPGTATITMTATYRNYPQYVCTDSVTITVLPAGEIVVNGASFEVDYLQLSTEAWGFAPTASEMTVNVDTNAPASQITYTWGVEREGVVAIEIPEGSDGRTARFTSIGGMTEGLRVTCRVQVGNVYDQTLYGYIDAFAPTFSASPDQAVYNLNVNETQRMNWSITGEHLAALQSTRTYSSNESVAFADSYGMLVAVAPGTAVITREFYYNGVLAGSAQVTVNVTGAAASFTHSTIEIGVGESLPLTEYLNLQGVTAISQNWISADEDVALLSSEGVIYGVAPGRTIVTHVTYGTDVQNYEAICEVIVTGEPEASAFTLSDTRISLFYEKQHQLRAYFNGQDVTDQVAWSMDYINEWAMDLSDTGLLTGLYVKVPLIATVIAEYTAGGRIHTAKCYVEVQPQMISVSGGLFSSSNGILYMTAGETQYIYDNYCVASDDIEVELQITSDNESVARIDGNYIVAVGAGETDLHYTVTGSNGETYTLPLHVCVDMAKYTPTDFLLPDDSIVLVHDIYVIRPQVLPAYAEYTCSYQSNDTSVCTVDEYGIVTKANPGRTTIDVTLTGENGVPMTKSISVLSLGNVTLAPADGRTILEPGETVQLVFSGEHMWNDDEVLSIDIYNHYGNGIGLTQDGVLTTYQRNYVDTNMNGEYTGQYYIPATIALKGGQFYSCTYAYTLNYTDRYFYATTGGINTEHLIANPGDRYSIVGYTNENWMTAVSYTYSSTNSSVASVDMYGTLTCHAVGSAVITVSAVYSDGTTGQDTLAVTVIPSEDLIVTLEPERRLLHVGETIQAAFVHNGSTTYSLDDFTYTSSNPKVLICNPPDEYGTLTFTALAPGQADLTITGTYDGHKTASDTVTIYVVATDGNSIIRSAALSSDYVELSRSALDVQGIWMEIDSNVDPSQFTYTWEIADESIAAYYYPDENDHSVIHLSAASSPDAQSGETTVSCRVQCGDFFDVTYTAAVKVADEPVGEIVVNGASFEEDYLRLSTEAWGYAPTASEMTVNVDTNAPADQITYTWGLEREGVVAIEIPEGSDGRTARFTSIGDVAEGLQITCRVQVGDVYDQVVYGYIDAIVPTFSLSASQEVYNLKIDDNISANWTVNGTNLGIQTLAVSHSSDESVVIANPSGFLQAMGEGTATVTRSYYYNGAYAGSKTITVNVTGGYADFEQKEITLHVGDTLQLTVDTNVAPSDIIAENWFTSDEAVADITDRNLVYAIGPGRTTVRYLVSTAEKSYQAECVVHVIGDEEASIFTLSDTELDLHAESSYKLRAYLNGRDISSQVTWSTNDLWLLPVDDTGLIVTPDLLFSTMEGTVTAEYHYQGKIYRASCHIIVHGSKLDTNGHQFNENNSLFMNVGDRMQITDFYQINDESITVTETFSSDNENIARVEDGYIVAVGKGNTTLYYTVTASSGESFTRPLAVLVETSEPTLTGFSVPENTIVLTGTVDRYISITPNEKTSAYDVEYASRDESVLRMNDNLLVPVSPGRTFVDVTVTSTDGSFCETKAVEVLVILDSVTMEPEDGRTTLMPGDTVQLVYKGPYLWNEDEVERITYHNPMYIDNEIILTDDGLMTVIDVSESTSFVVSSTVVFKDDSHVDLSYAFNLNRDDRYFYVTLSPLGYHALIANPGDSVELCLFSNDEVVSYTYESSNESVASVYVNEPSDPYLHCNGVGQAVITTTAHFADGTSLSYETPVEVISSESFYMKARATERVIHVGQSTYPYPELSIPNTFSPGLTFTSSDPSALSIVFHEDGTVEAIAHRAGVFDITIGIANAPHLYDTVTIYVVD